MNGYDKALEEVRNHYPMPKIVEQAAFLLNYDLWYEPIETAVFTYGDGTAKTFYENLTGRDWSNSCAQIECPKCGYKVDEIKTIFGITPNMTRGELWSIVEAWLETLPSTVYVDLDGDCCMCDRAEDFCYCEDLERFDEDDAFDHCAWCDGDMSVYEVNVAEAILPKEVWKQYV